MRIAYVCYLVGWHADGVGDKISSQLNAWVAAGNEATLYLLNPRSPTGERRPLPGEQFLFSSPVERILATRRLYAAVARAEPDLVYLRYDLFVPPPSALTRIAPTVIEFNSYAQIERRHWSSKAALYERFQEHLLLRRAAGAVCVSHELAAAVRRKLPNLAVRTIANGVEMSDLPILPAPAGAGIRAAFLGEDSLYQGVDKIFELAAALPEWQFDLIGVDAERSQGNVTCHGYLTRKQYEPILSQADVAIGSLAHHRIGIVEHSTLKAQRYVAYGLPVILGYDETQFVGTDPWFLLRLPSTESNIRDGIERIRAFGNEVKGRRVARSEVADRVSVAGKEAERLAFFAQHVSAAP